MDGTSDTDIKILFFGDVCGKPGRLAVRDMIPKLREKYSPDIIATNVENIAHGRGATKKTLDELLSYGIDFMTAGNHIWRNDEFHEFLVEGYPIIRPMNYPDDLPGVGFKTYSLGGKGEVLFISLMGVTFFHNERTLAEPFRAIGEFLDNIDTTKYAAIFLDFHAEATSEKITMAHYLDGRVSAVVGTHTHIPTADERVLPGGTAYITDVGMVGPMNSSLWVKTEIAIQSNMYPFSPRFDIEDKGPVRVDAVLIAIKSYNKAISITRINEAL